MLFVLGIGSTVGMGSCILRVIRDQFGRRAGPSWALAGGLATLGFGVSIVYMTPGGQFILNLVDFYGVSFTALILAIGELLAVSWFYGIYATYKTSKLVSLSTVALSFHRCASLLRRHQIHDGHRNGLLLAPLLGLHYTRPHDGRPALHAVRHVRPNVQGRGISTAGTW